MKIRFVQIGIQLLIIASFFLKIFNYHVGEDVIPITGFEALIKNKYFIIGNIVIAFILFASIYHLITQIFVILKNPIYQKLDQILTIVITLQLLFGMIVVTFLGTYLEVLGIIIIGLTVLGVMIKHWYKI
ncbi:MAG: hypothetical protein ABH890_00700 [Bacillota bacterium]